MKINSEKIKNAEIKIKNTQSYFTCGRRYIWLNDSKRQAESNKQLLLRALSIATLVIPIFNLFLLLLLKTYLHFQPKKVQKTESQNTPVKIVETTKEKLPENTFSFFQNLPTDCVGEILERCATKDLLVLATTCKNLHEVNKTSTRRLGRQKIYKNLSPKAKTIEAKIPTTSDIVKVFYHSKNQELYAVEQVDYNHDGDKHIFVFDKDLIEKESYVESCRLTPHKFVKSINQVIYANNENVILISYKYNTVHYWNRKENTSFYVDEFDNFELLNTLGACYSNNQRRFYLGILGEIRIYDEDVFEKTKDNSPRSKAIESIKIPENEIADWIKIDEKENKLWIITTPTGNQGSVGSLICYDCSSKQSTSIKNPFSAQYGYDTENLFHFSINRKLIIGMNKSEFIAWDTSLNQPAKQISIPPHSSEHTRYFDEVNNRLFFIYRRLAECSRENPSLQFGVWNIESNTLNFLNLEMLNHLGHIDQIDYNSQTNVFIIHSGSFVGAWDLKTCKIIRYQIKNSIDKFIWDKEENNFIFLGAGHIKKTIS